MDNPNLSAHRFFLLGVTALLLLIGGFSAWSATARISGAIVAHGTLKGDDDKHPIQSQTGGTIVSINVRDGDTVEKILSLPRLTDNNCCHKEPSLTASTMRSRPRFPV